MDDQGRIVDAKFKTFGCGSAIASSSLATEWIKGKTVCLNEYSISDSCLGLLTGCRQLGSGKKIPKAGNLLPALIPEPPRHQPNRCSRVVSATLSYGDSVHDICSFQHHHSCEAVELTQSAVIWRQLPPIINWSTAQNISGPRIQISRELASLPLVC